eukprot:6206548-Pleurochrysis_carterae.AAC.5
MRVPFGSCYTGMARPKQLVQSKFLYSMTDYIISHIRTPGRHGAARCCRRIGHCVHAKFSQSVLGVLLILY